MFTQADLDELDNRLFDAWKEKQYAAPSPDRVREQVLLRLGQADAIWVETGTFKGNTTHFLALNSRFVFSIEPEPTLFAHAVKRFEGRPNIQIINGLSEVVLPALMPSLPAEVNFWLDGHYSAGDTHKGPVDTPIIQELACIEENIAKFSKLTVLIDDIRCFNPAIEAFADYPSVDYLVDWARRVKLFWHIEHDIFVATNVKPTGL